MGKTINHKINLSAVREEQKADGFFDGRFRTKVKGGANQYKRRQKHRGHNWDD
jgi:hypothetical protein